MTPRIISAPRKNEYARLAQSLAKGGVLIYPTDTAYALGADVQSATGVARIFKIKQRDKAKPLPLIAADVSMVRGYAHLSSAAEKLARKYWPGPLTMVLPAKRGVSFVQGVMREDTVAIRVPDSMIARSLSRGLGRPIVSTSANKAGAPTPYDIQEARRGLGESFNEMAYAIDAGALEKERGVSTIVKVCDNSMVVMRQGPIAITS